jgi:hypothetical protein
MRDVYSSKWQEVNEDEIKWIIPIILWDLEKILRRQNSRL